MLNIPKVGITGGIGSGKSWVARIFNIYGIPVYNADKEAKRLMFRNKALKTKIRQLLGPESFHRNGRINRSFIASRIFNDKKLLKQMNAIVHPAVREDFEKWASAQNAEYVLEESAIIFEESLDKFFDAVILVVADKEIRINRVMRRDKVSRKQVEERMRNQLNDEIKKKRADFIILNDGSTGVIRQVDKVHKSILKLKKKTS